MTTNTTFPDGVYTVLVTPFNSDFSINWDNLEKWVYRQINSPIAGLVLLGTTSEIPTLKKSEQFEIVKFVNHVMVKHDSKKFLCVGIGGNNTKKAQEFAIKCAPWCDAFMVTVPNYNMPGQDGVIAHFQAICNEPCMKEKPVILYNVPKRTGTNAEPETVKAICDTCPNVKAIKEASGNLLQIEIIRDLMPELKVFSGDDKLLVDVMRLKGNGVISVASNAYPEIVCSLYDQCVKDISSANDLFKSCKFGELCDALFCVSNPRPIKYFLFRLRMFDTCALRLPMLPLPDDKKKIVDDVMAFYAV